MIIAFAGQKGAGKTTCAHLAGERMDDASIRFSFAALLKRIAVDIWGPTFDQRPPDDHFDEFSAFYGDQEDKEQPSRYFGGRTGREFLQELGSLARKYNPNVWLNVLQDDPDHVVLIDDARYLNEIARIKELGGIVVGVRGPGPMDLTGHASESELALNWHSIGFDYEIINDKSKGFDRLIEDVDCILGAEGLL